MTIPLRHFVVGLGFLLAGALVGLGHAAGVVPGRTALAHVHLLLVGWVGLTIMGAMTQFVPVWSGTTLHSTRLATAHLWTVTLGLLGFAGALLTGSLALLPAFGGVLLVGFWTFVYNVGRTLVGVRPFDVTERHFAAALAFFVLLTSAGFLLALGYHVRLPVARLPLRNAHVTLAVFGAVLTTVVGALYQLATMFTQSDLAPLDRRIRDAEQVAYPLGVLVLALGRLLSLAWVARLGGLLVTLSLAAFGVLLARRLVDARVAWTPMLRRYAVVAVAMVGWSAATLPTWLARPLAAAAVLGAPHAHLLLLGVVAFVVLGTLYHVVPFIVWVHRYSDRLGLDDVPMVDDLYDARLARVEFVLSAGGFLGLVAGPVLSRPWLTLAGGVVATLGFALASAVLLSVLRVHAPRGIAGTLFDAFVPASDAGQSPGGSK